MVNWSYMMPLPLHLCNGLTIPADAVCRMYCEICEVTRFINVRVSTDAWIVQNLYITLVLSMHEIIQSFHHDLLLHVLKLLQRVPKKTSYFVSK